MDLEAAAGGAIAANHIRGRIWNLGDRKWAKTKGLRFQQQLLRQRARFLEERWNHVLAPGMRR